MANETEMPFLFVVLGGKNEKSKDIKSIWAFVLNRSDSKGNNKGLNLEI